MTRPRAALAALAGALLLTVAGVALSPPAAAASLAEVTNFGDNPGGMRMHIYVPDTRSSNPAIVVAMHGCGGSGPGFYSGSEFASLADQYGFIVIYPTATQQAGFGNCFDTWSEAAKRRGGGSDPVSIVSMISYAQNQHGADPSRVYATGSSSGGMMTQHMLAVYPDVFQAGASFMGVPFDCFANAADYPPGSSQCTGGNMDRTPQQWGDAVRQAYPGYTGARPRVQLWHGTNDTLVPYQLLQESIEQWTNVFGLSQTPTSTDTPRANWNRARYGAGQVEAYRVQGAGHSLPMSGMALTAIQFFGLDQSTPTSPPPPSPPPISPPPPSPPPISPPPPSPPPISPPPPSPPPTGSACSAAFQMVNSWPGGFQGSVAVSNNGGATLNGWSVSLSLPSGVTISSLWNGEASGTSGSVTVRNAAYNGTVAGNGSVTFGFVANGSGSPTVTGCTSP